MKIITILLLALSIPLLFLATRPSDAHTSWAFPPLSYSHIAIYDLQYQPDSTNQKVRTSTMALLINDQGSLFGAYGNLNFDTAYYAEKQRGGKRYRFKLRPPRDFYIMYHIFKQKSAIVTFDKIAVVGSPYFQYTENVSGFKWTILEDTATILGYHCQKAACRFGGRNWIAWFTMDIPVSDGPYKFAGLPGLIVQIADERSYWKFKLIQFTNTSYTYNDEALKMEKVEKSSKAGFLRLLKASYDNGFEMEQQYGITFQDSLDVEKQRYRIRAKTENNWIEKYESR